MADMEQLVTIAAFDLASEADVMKLLLEEAGIEVFLADDKLVGMNWFLANAVGGAKLQVVASKAELARALVEQHRERSRERRQAGAAADYVRVRRVWPRDDLPRPTPRPGGNMSPLPGVRRRAGVADL